MDRVSIRSYINHEILRTILRNKRGNHRTSGQLIKQD